ncbi:RNA-guided endonuclease InsQ/TnpB family protein [Variovorax sp. JS1663]|uniref:RNA-guided endonuclease InsQ/TnpB family protein n=1 Tax=Variovorax sp. JS1663 TaxID=1851577 RepID=UPI000B349814|nr:RNA-guided endonuclease TnpB family protein [Variovorax sp. JS1663]OUM00745.1 hypothetical protein A8M77_19865 [Variovorax sp. JS1663]
MLKGFEFRAYPSKVVQSILLRWIGCQRFIYNARVREDHYFRTMQRKRLALVGQYPEQDQSYARYIGDGNGNPEEDTRWLREVPPQLLRNGVVLFSQAYTKFFKKLAGRPTVKKRHGRQSVWVTSELFRFEPVPVSQAKSVQASRQQWRLILGNAKFPCGELPFAITSVPEDQKWQPPKTIHISVDAGRWHVSFCNEDDALGPDAADTLVYLRQYSKEELLDQTIGVDLGVKVPLMAAEAQGISKGFALKPIEHERLQRKEVQRRRWQRIAARRQAGSKNKAKARHRVAAAARYAADLRKDFAHQVSRALVDHDVRLIVFEALQIKNMTRSAKGTAEAPGKNVRQKTGLNRSILGSAWGQVRLYTEYKALAAGKLAIRVDPKHSSQECSACGHTHPDNRPSQEQFVCQRCGHTENADTNAARNIARRGVEAIVSGSYTLKRKKKAGSVLRKSKAEDDQREGRTGPGTEQVSESHVCGDTVRRRRRNAARAVVEEAETETPTTSALAV